MKQNQIHHVPLVSEGARSTRDLDSVVLEVGRQRIERARVSHLPTVKGGAVVLSRADNQSLPTIVHPVGSRPSAGINALHAYKISGETVPLAESGGSNTHVPQRYQVHATSYAVRPSPS